MHPDSCVEYLEHVITAWKEEGADFHDQLAESYIRSARTAAEKKQDGE